MSEVAKIGLMRVIKKLSPSSRGAIKLHEQFGDALLCVRHRVDAAAKIRYTTVELLVARAPIKPRSHKLVGVRIAVQERSLQHVIKAAGGVWDGREQVWKVPQRLVSILRLTDRLVRT